ncbi:uncharacterized protein AKAW2_30923A [Aspergillus luchuensis]|uniref:Uncharacterized protein n=1 Tax=Aspergillus kawachii TaxID=1069201 RepID=A0A7R7W771_ASPKA|nr:uncharacterized protein AKAW2_30923A [Aspergillus luchuensis]BCR97604.1 hypothetical protein AKAW2_30923A [Aspergillus luchuensis]
MQPECTRSMIQLMEGECLTTLHIVTEWMIVCAVYKPHMMARDSGGRKSPFQGPGSRTSIDPHFDLSQPVVRWGIGRRGSLSIESIQLLANSLPWTEPKLARKQATTT